MKFHFQPAPESANPANPRANKGEAAGKEDPTPRAHGAGFATDSHGFAPHSHAGRPYPCGSSRDSQDSHGSRAAHTEKRYLSPALESRIRAMASRWDYSAEELNQALDAARDEPEGWLAVVEQDEQRADIAPGLAESIRDEQEAAAANMLA